MKAVDSSVAVAAFASWHELHEPARDALDERPLLPVQAALETYSVLTRLPAPHRAPAALVREFLEVRFADRHLEPAPGVLPRLVAELEERGILGGATYDAAIAAAVREAGATLVSCDRRAEPTYLRMGVAFERLTPA